VNDKRAPKILVYLIGSLGDTIIALPALQTLRRHYGNNAQIYLLYDLQPKLRVTPEHLLEGNPLVNGFINYKIEPFILRRIWLLLSLWCKIIRRKFDVVVYLAPSERSFFSVFRDRLFFMLCLIPRRIGFYAFDKEFLYPADGFNSPQLVAHEATCRLERLRLAGIDISRDADLSGVSLYLPPQIVDNMRNWLAQRRKCPDKNLVAICPGSEIPAKQWPIERFIEIGRRLLEQGKSELIVIGDRRERNAGEQIIKEWGSGINAAGCFSIMESAALFKFCAFSIGLDSGATHLAAVAGIPCVAIYSHRYYPSRWYPFGNKYAIVSHPVGCAGCLAFVCPLKGHPCMQMISTNDVWKAVNSLPI
jgi:ADP-heptose:LPS heptosyltransferase